MGVKVNYKACDLRSCQEEAASTLGEEHVGREHLSRAHRGNLALRDHLDLKGELSGRPLDSESGVQGRRLGSCIGGCSSRWDLKA